MTTIHVPPGEGRHYRMIACDHVAKAVVPDSAGSFEVVEVVAPAAPTAPTACLAVERCPLPDRGTGQAFVGDTSYDVQPGGVVNFPAERACTFEVVGDSARSLAVTQRHGVSLVGA